MLVMQDTPSTSSPMWRAAIASGTVDMPTASAPMVRTRSKGTMNVCPSPLTRNAARGSAKPLSRCGQRSSSSNRLAHPATASETTTTVARITLPACDRRPAGIQGRVRRDAGGGPSVAGQRRLRGAASRATNACRFRASCVLAPFRIGAAVLMTGSNRLVPSLGGLNLIFILAIFAPSNRPSYNPQAGGSRRSWSPLQIWRVSRSARGRRWWPPPGRPR